MNLLFILKSISFLPHSELVSAQTLKGIKIFHRKIINLFDEKCLTQRNIHKTIFFIFENGVNVIVYHLIGLDANAKTSRREFYFRFFSDEFEFFLGISTAYHKQE